MRDCNCGWNFADYTKQTNVQSKKIENEISDRPVPRENKRQESVKVILEIL